MGDNNYLPTLSSGTTSEISQKIGLPENEAPYIMVIIQSDGTLKLILPDGVFINPDEHSGSSPLDNIEIKLTPIIPTPSTPDPSLPPLDSIMKPFGYCKVGGKWVQC